jgi:hypothetical protein
MNPAPVLATFIVRRGRPSLCVTERRYPARVISMQGDQVEIAYLQDDGTIRNTAANADQVEVHL